ncbi:sterol desaturase family protein [Lentisphaera profundi]|uniref:Sterol desaturase family protein n=1 Tax=Lentisphaera profundi TaxID=1658616 RepID=A0ABY7VU45_9BACT|nr:sterol desaturase family protein [Lentisphaera profundi]WDE96417.1 sterol desaturase family protein [Lentisphaera profundi]
MREFLDLVLNMPAWQKLAIVIFSLSLCWLLETWNPLFKFNYDKKRHGLTNLSLFLWMSLINFFFGLFLVYGLDFFQSSGFGLLQIISLPLWFEFVLSVLILDFIAQYVIHVCLHKIPWMWKFHVIHHSDEQLDASSGTRHHPIDYLLREVYSFIALVLLGIPAAYYFTFRLFTIFFTYINHANISVPTWLNRPLSLIFVTPDLHKIHHHRKQPWTDQNYGNIFSFWDRIFGTLIEADSRDVEYGLDSLGEGFDAGVKDLLLLPWKKDDTHE